MNKFLKIKPFLHETIQDVIIRKIESGEFKAGEKLPGERKLCEMFAASRGTVKNALQRLEQNKLLKRIPAKGTFIASPVDRMNSSLKIAFPFPEKTLSRDYLRYDVWYRNSEIYRGIIDGAVGSSASISFMYIEPTDNREWLQKQCELIKEYDGAIFVGGQLINLIKTLDLNAFPYSVIALKEPINGPEAHFDPPSVFVKKCADITGKLGYKTAGIIEAEFSKNSASEYRKIFTENFSKYHGKVIDEWIIGVDYDESKAISTLEKVLPKTPRKLPEIFFCSYLVPAYALMEVIRRRGWKMPEEISVIALGVDMQQRPTTPLLTSIRFPFFELGRKAFDLLLDHISVPSRHLKQIELPVHLIPGKTTRKINPTMLTL